MDKLDNPALHLDITGGFIDGRFVNSTQTLEAAKPLDLASPQLEKAGRFHQLDGLRAVAVLLVLFHHSVGARIGDEILTGGLIRLSVGETTAGHILSYVGQFIRTIGGSGVELFFVLSGIVLLRPYLRGQRSFNIASYFKRRALRLWPPYIVVLILEGIMLWVMTRWPNSFTVQRPTFSVRGWLSQVGILNLGWDMYNVAWWSLTVELIFYLVAPLLVPVFASRWMTRLVFLWVMILAFAGAVALYIVALPADSHNSRAQRFFDTHGAWQALANFGIYLPCFLLGLAAAKYDVPRRVGHVLLWVGLAYVLLAIQIRPLNVHAGFGLLYAGLTILAFDVGSAWMRFLSSPLMVWLGERSYSLFLIHFTIFTTVNYLVVFFVREKTDAYFLLTRGIGVPLALLAAMTLFYFVERRFARNLVTDKSFWPVW